MSYCTEHPGWRAQSMPCPLCTNTKTALTADTRRELAAMKAAVGRPGLSAAIIRELTAMAQSVRKVAARG